MTLRHLRVEFTKVTGEELVTVPLPGTHEAYEEGCLTIDELNRIKAAGFRHIKQTIGYSGAVKVRVRM